MKSSNRVRIKPDINRSLDYYMGECAMVISGVPGVKMTKSDVVSEIVMNFLAGKGHYPPKDDLPKSDLPISQETRSGGAASDGTE